MAATTDHPIYPHGALVEVLPGLWQVRGSQAMPLPRNMTVVRLADGGLLLYSVIALDAAGMAALEALGTPRAMIVPHSMHSLDAPFYLARYPQLRVGASDVAAAKVSRPIRVDGSAQAIVAELGDPRVQARDVPGINAGEVALLVETEAGRAVVLTDCVANLRPAKGISGRLLGLLGVPGGGVGVPRIVRFRQVSDRKALVGFLRELAAAPNLRALLVAHGEPIVGDVAAALEQAAAAM